MKRYSYFSVFLYILFLICLSVCLYEAGTEIVFKVELTLCAKKSEHFISIKRWKPSCFVSIKNVTRKTKMFNWKGWFRLHHFSNWNKKCSPLDPYNMYKYNLVNKLQGLAHSLRNNLGPADLGSLGIWLFVVELVLEKEPGSVRW